ncbi:hypothetical protein Ctob_011079, partial [Chrysochromulina tobinii]
MDVTVADGGGDGGGDGIGEATTVADAIALIARVLPGTAPSEVSAVDAAAALLRLSPVEMGLYLGATLLAPPTASMIVPTAAPETARGVARGVAAIWDAHHAAGSATTDEAAALRRGDVSVPTAPMVAAERVLAFGDVAKADSEARRAHAAHTLLRYVRRLESALPSEEGLGEDEGDEDEDEVDGTMMRLME